MSDMYGNIDKADPIYRICDGQDPLNLCTYESCTRAPHGRGFHASGGVSLAPSLTRVRTL